MGEELLHLAPPTQTICESLGLSNHADLQAQSRYSNCTCPGLSFLLVNDCFFPLVRKQLSRDQVATEPRESRERAPCKRVEQDTSLGDSSPLKAYS